MVADHHDVPWRESGIKAASGMDEVVLAWNSQLRYASKRNGYHGGCAPVEALVPFATYRHGVKVSDGWEIRDEAEPDWWVTSNRRHL